MKCEVRFFTQLPICGTLSAPLVGAFVQVFAGGLLVSTWLAGDLLRLQGSDVFLWQFGDEKLKVENWGTMGSRREGKPDP